MLPDDQREGGHSMKADAEPLLSVRGATKIYAGVYALDGVDFDAYPGEIHALLGENGAGKSTLCKIISGAVPLSSGTLSIGKVELRFRSPLDSLRAGVAMVYQETSLVPTMTVAQNLFLGNERLLTRFNSINNDAQALLSSLGFDVDPLALVEQLGSAQRQMVEIARAVRLNARVLIFDEPTASLTAVETRRFFDLLRNLRRRGAAIIFISHALEEALELSDRITILRDGQRVRCGFTSEFDRPKLIKLMVGRDLPSAVTERSEKYVAGDRREAVLAVEDVMMGKSVNGMSFSLYAGEVVGIAGLVGSGRSEAAKVVSGIVTRGFVEGGAILFRGKAVSYRSPRQAIRSGIVYITEDRKLNGFFETMTADENIYLASLASRGGWRFWYSRKQAKGLADRWTTRLSIAALSRKLKLIAYSGGNQQKVVIAKALAQGPEVIFFDEPTRGVDVGAIPQIHQTIRELARQGKAVVVISSYLPEVISISDRILVARGGRIVSEFAAAEATEEAIMHAAVH
jgi:ABC-type sugar transport system ATPase subunit